MKNETHVFTDSTLERYKNEIKRAFAMEVIEAIERNRKETADLDWNRCYTQCVKTVQSLLPKEEETKTESDEVKVDFKGDEFTLIHDNGTISWIHAPHQEMGMLVRSSELKPVDWLEQKARKKAEEIYKEWAYGKRPAVEHITEALLIDPKTL